MDAMASYFTDQLVQAGFYIEHYGTANQHGWFVAAFGFCGGMDWGGPYFEWCGAD